MFVGYIAEYFSYVEPTDDQFRDVCLFSLGLVLAGLLASFAHAYGGHMGYIASMDARIIATSAIYQKVLMLCSLGYSYVHLWWGARLLNFETEDETWDIDREMHE